MNLQRAPTMNGSRVLSRMVSRLASGLTTGATNCVDFEGKAKDIAPFVSVVLIVATLFSVVFCKMEMRRMGYSVLKLTREERKMRDHERQAMIQLAKITRPERLQALAQARLTLKRAENGQIIQMSEHGVAFKQ